MFSFQRLFLIALSLFLTAVVSTPFDAYHFTAVTLIGGFIALALAVRQRAETRGIAFTISIFAAVAAAMFYPAAFLQIGNFSTKQLIIPLLMLIMFGMGTAMSVKDFMNVIRMPKGVLVGLMCQFTIMPFIGFGLAYWSDFPPEIAAGIILVGCSPSGLASNVMAYLAGANLALSLTLTAVATLLAPLVTPTLMKLLADQLVPIDFWAMLWSMLKIVILPVVAGLIFNHLAKNRWQGLQRALPTVSMVSIAIIIAVITAAGRDSLLSIGLLLIGVVLIHNFAGYILGYNIAKWVGMSREEARTIAFEVGMQNSGLASGIALEMGRVATMGLAPAVFGPVMNISGSALATWWRRNAATKSE